MRSGGDTAKLCEACNAGGDDKAGYKKSFNRNRTHYKIYFIVSVTR